MARFNIPPVTRALLLILTVQSLLSAVIRYKQWTADSQIVIPYLTLIPQLSLFYPWTFVTTTLVEGNVFTLATGIATIYNGGRYLERAWSSKEFAKFLLVVALIPNTLCFGTEVLLFALTRRESWTLRPIAGTTSLQIAFLVAFSQLVPAHTVTLFRGFLSLRVPRLPLLYLALVFILGFIPLSTFGSGGTTLLNTSSAFLSFYAFLVSWTYLRFYKVVFPDLESSNIGAAHTHTYTSSGGIRGDASESFAFAEFFPGGPVKKAVAAMGEQIYEVLVAMKVCTPFDSGSASSTSGSQQHHYRPPSTTSGSGGGGARAEQERRRALALKALDQRLNLAAARGPATPAVTKDTTAVDGSIGASDAAAAAVSKPATSSAQPTEDNSLGETNYEPDDGFAEKGSTS